MKMSTMTGRYFFSCIGFIVLSSIILPFSSSDMSANRLQFSHPFVSLFFSSGTQNRPHLQRPEGDPSPLHCTLQQHRL